MQGGSGAFLAPMFAILALPEYSCKVGSGRYHDKQTYVHTHDDDAIKRNAFNLFESSYVFISIQLVM